MEASYLEEEKVESECSDLEELDTVDTGSFPPKKVPKIEEKQCQAKIEIKIGNSDHAAIIATALSVDPEVRPSLVQRRIVAKDGVLFISFETVDIKSLRASMGSVLELAQVAQQACAELPPEALAVKRQSLNEQSN